MIRHMLLFSLRDEVSDEDRQALLHELGTFPDVFATMREFQLGANESRRDQTFQYGMTVAFESFDDLHAYLDSERHERFVATRFRPLVSARAIVSFEA